jgi:hypothetical protein
MVVWVLARFPSGGLCLGVPGRRGGFLDGGQLGDDLSDGYAGASTAIGLGGGGRGSWGGLRRACRMASWTAWTPLAQRGPCGLADGAAAG